MADPDRKSVGLTLLTEVTPERLCTSVFRNILAALYRTSGINRLVVDEVDIIRSLRMSEKNMFKAIHPFNRANLFYEVRYSSAPDSVSQMEAIAEYIHTLYRRRGRPSSGIVYCRARNTCDEIASHLRRRAINARPYHARIGQDIERMGGWWQRRRWCGRGEDFHTMVCPIAELDVGMRHNSLWYIIHYDLPKSFEGALYPHVLRFHYLLDVGYYQETGTCVYPDEILCGLPNRSKVELVAMVKSVLARYRLTESSFKYFGSAREDAMRARKFVSDSYATRVAKISDGPEPSQRSTGSLESVCKYPGKTRQRKILTAELQSAVIAPIVKATPRPESLWRTKLRDDDKDEAFRPSVKRNLDESSNELPKKQRFEPPPPLGASVS
ncbi:ATP-dependent DNA helicase [Salix suchowensis]|nr:ATP-dependent DNA helicase [Salix suchowensis]